MKKIICLSFILGLLIIPLSIKAQVSSDLLKEYLFPVSYGASAEQNDVIGLRIYKNTNNTDPMTWYLNNVNNPKNTLPEIKVDGYVAVRDDRTVYIQASNLVNLTTTRNFYTNIYVLAYNQNASKETVEIFNQMLANMKFNRNVMGFYCLKTQYEAVKDSLRRDTVRKADLYKLTNILESSSGFDLSAGTYVPNVSISTWPSWQATLGMQLGSALPIDPLNIMADRLISCTANEQCATGQCSGGYCSACNLGWDARTCWNERTLNYQKVDGFVYKYNNGVLTIRYEYPQILFPEVAGCFLGCNLDGQYYALGSCQANNQYCATAGWVANVCGDGIVRCNEICEGANCSSGCLSCIEHFHSEGSLCVADTEPTTVLTQTLSTAEERRWTGSDLSAPYATACIANAYLDGAGVCHCKTNYHEEVTDGVSSCVADTRWFTCNPKPEHTVWNTVSAFQQGWDGEKWVPLTPETEFNPEFNEEPSNSSCRFKTVEDYHWECEGTACSSVPNRGDECSMDAADTAWYIWVEGTNDDYVCTAETCVANATLTNGTCACNTNLTWDGTACQPDIRDFVCQNLPTNAVWNNISDGIYEQTWNVATLSWLPADSEPVHNDAPLVNTCRYKCSDTSTWDDDVSQCVPNTCGDFPDMPAAVTSCGDDENILVPAGTSWHAVESCTAGLKCEYTCNPTFHLENGTCVANSCEATLPLNATICKGVGTGLLVNNTPWTVVSSPWDGTDNDCTGASCEYKCNDGYYKSGNSCVPISTDNFGFVYKFVAQWTTAWPADDNFDLIIRNPAGANAYDGSTKDDIKSGLPGYDYAYRNEVVVISKTYNTSGTGINSGTYKVYINENESATAKLYNCEDILRLDVYAFDGTSRIMSIPCTPLGSRDTVDNWWILDVSLPYGIITVPGAKP